MRASPSASALTIVALSASFVLGAAWSIVTDEIVGAAFPTVTAGDVAGAEDAVPSETTTRTATESPLSPLPAAARSSVAPVSPARSVPFLTH